MGLLPLTSCKLDPFCQGSHKRTFAFFDPADHCRLHWRTDRDLALPACSVADAALRVSTSATHVIMVKQDQHLSRIYTSAFKKTRPGAEWGSGMKPIPMIQINFPPFG